MTTCGPASAGSCPGCATQQISTHWIRHTTLTWVERNFGYAVAHAYAGHTDSGGDAGATSTYVRASDHRGRRRAGRPDRRTPSARHDGRMVIRMAAVIAGTRRADAADGPGLRGPSPARTAGPAAADRSQATARRARTVRSWPLLVLAAPAAAEVWSGWVGIAQKTGFGLVSPLPGIWPSLHLDTSHHPAGRRRGLRGVCLARLAGQRACGQRPDAPVREVVGDLLLRARHGRAGRLPPAGPGRGDTGAVGDHHHRVLPAGPGPGHGDRTGPHAARRRRHRGGARHRDHGTSHPPVPRLVPRGPDSTGPDADQTRTSPDGRTRRPGRNGRDTVDRSGTESPRSGMPTRPPGPRDRHKGPRSLRSTTLASSPADLPHPGSQYHGELCAAAESGAPTRP